MANFKDGFQNPASRHRATNPRAPRTDDLLGVLPADEPPRDVIPVEEPPRGRRLYLGGLLTGALLVLVLGGGLVVVWWWLGQPLKLGGPPTPSLQLTNARSSGFGFSRTFSVDYGFVSGAPDPADHYFLVLVFDDGQRLERGVFLQHSGSLSMSVRSFGPPQLGRGGFDQGVVEISLERQTMTSGSAQRLKASNAVRTR